MFGGVQGFMGFKERFQGFSGLQGFMALRLWGGFETGSGSEGPSTPNPNNPKNMK